MRLPPSSSASSAAGLLGAAVLCVALSTSWGLAAERRPWNVLRFLQQSSRFVRLPLLSRAAGERVVRPGDVLWRLGDGDSNAFTMAPLDDVVMGGASASTFQSGTGVWSGTVTDANSGGFIGIRSTPGIAWNMRNCRGLEWKVQVNAPAQGVRRYKFVVRDSTDFNGVTWTTCVDLKPGLNTVRIDFARQTPARFARRVPGQTFQREKVAAVQISYSKFEYDGGLNPRFELGDIELQLLELKAF